jgi:hypothetical protein
MTKPCPICNFQLHTNEEVAEEKCIDVHCHDCGEYKMDLALVPHFRRKFLGFDRTTAGGRELYDHNIHTIRRFLARHHQDIMTENTIKEISGLHRPRQ